MIKVLDKSIADKIAAGEVIERPVSIIKELVENAIDAGASSIVVEIKNGGKNYIRVTDNGCGILPDEVETAFLRHATSKISTSGDLDSIETLGFRGEALASIAAVTRTELLTKSEQCKAGRRLVMHGGEVISNEQTGCPNGTTMIVTDLFYNTPARLKFLKTDAAESSLIIDFISQIALAFKDIKFRMINNGKILFTTAGDGNRMNNIIRIFSSVDAASLVSVNYEDEHIKLEGYISTPALSKTSRKSQIFFVNGRVVNSKVMEKGVALGYKERLFEGRFPVTYLFLTVNPQELDVNIHPNKREVRFDNEQTVITVISQAIIEALGTKDAVVNAGSLFKETSPKEVSKTYDRLFEKDYNQTQVDIKQILSLKSKEDVESCPADIVSRTAAEKALHEKDTAAFCEPKNSTYVPEPAKIEIKPESFLKEPLRKPFDFSQLSITGSVFGTYITAVDENSFYFIDQHAAHERIFYEKLVKQYETDEKTTQPIMIPLMINVSVTAAEEAELWLEPLHNMGFTIGNFGQNTFRITEIPTFMEITEAEEFVQFFVENFEEAKQINNRVVIDKLIMKSCKSAVKAHDFLKDEEIAELIKELSQCVNPFSCPHGRPTFIKLTNHEIERLFKRIQ